MALCFVSSEHCCSPPNENTFESGFCWVEIFREQNDFSIQLSIYKCIFLVYSRKNRLNDQGSMMNSSYCGGTLLYRYGRGVFIRSAVYYAMMNRGEQRPRRSDLIRTTPMRLSDSSSFSSLPTRRKPGRCCAGGDLFAGGPSNQ